MALENSRGVQQHEVDAAADALVAQRLRPTVERVRAQIGRGSPNRVGPMLERWFSGLAPRLGITPPDGEEVPGGAPAIVRHAFDTIWSSALQAGRVAAKGELERERALLAQQLQDLDAARAAVQRDGEALAVREADLRQDLELLRSHLADSAARVKELTQTVQEREAALAKARQATADLAQERSSERRHYDEQLQLHAQERERLQQHFASNERRLLEEVDRVRQDAKLARREVMQADERCAASARDSQRILDAQAARLQETLLELATMRERADAAQQRIVTLEGARSSAGQRQRGPSAKPRGRKVSGTAAAARLRR